ncbi:MAG: lactonase family protein [Lachnospiraceae bacterium]|nr:lactonase family protein [Lachnospiraceae bacterium]
MGEKYVAYVGSYTHGKAKGITICDMDVEKGVLTAREEVEIGNPSYMCISTSGKYLYSVADFGIRAFEIMEDGSLRFINDATINGMRACHVSVDKNDRYIFTAGYHDGKLTVLELNPDGSVGKVKSEVFHKGMGSIAERTFRPHITCATLTPDQKFLVACDVGIDQVKIYQFNYGNGTIKLIDILRCELESAPRSMVFSPDGKFAYLICQLKKYVEVYAYSGEAGVPEFTLIERVSTVGKTFSKNSAVAAIKLSLDGKHMFCTNAGDNSIAFYNRDIESGRLEVCNVLPISGDYPKEMMVFPDGKRIASLNHVTGSITFFDVDYEKGLLVMHGKPLKTETPNCCIYKKLS